MKKYLFIISLASSFLFQVSVPLPIFAGNDITITCSSNSCEKSHDLPFFNELNIAPGYTNSQTLKVINNRPDSCNLHFQLKSPSPLSELSRVQTLSLISGQDIWYAGSLSNLYDGETHQLGNIDGNQYKDYLWTFSLNQSAGNEFQLQDNNFDIDLNFTCDSVSPTPTLTQSVDTSSSTQSTIQCNDEAPLELPQNLRAISGQNTVTLFWEEPTDTFTYYLIAYSDNPDAATYGNPNVGGKGTNSYTINNLSAGTLYYFKIRTGNGCAPGTFSNIISATPGGQVIENPPPATAFQPNILGIQDTIPNTTGSVEGVSCTNLFPFAFLLALLVNLIINPYRFVTLFVSILSFAFDYYLSKSTCQKYPYFYIFNLFSFLIPLLLSFNSRQKKHP